MNATFLYYEQKHKLIKVLKYKYVHTQRICFINVLHQVFLEVLQFIRTIIFLPFSGNGKVCISHKPHTKAPSSQD